MHRVAGRGYADQMGASIKENQLWLYACLTHRQTSGIVAFLPYINIPTRYILDANHTSPTTVTNPIVSDKIICRAGGVSVVMRTIMVIGARNGNIEAQNANGEFGLRIIGKMK